MYDRESKRDEIKILLYSCQDINTKLLAVLTPPYIYHKPFVSTLYVIPFSFVNITFFGSRQVFDEIISFWFF